MSVCPSAADLDQGNGLVNFVPYPDSGGAKTTQALAADRDTDGAARLGRAARIYRQREVKNGAAALIGGHPYLPFMRLDNRPADR
jgi:hypothetical protein